MMSDFVVNFDILGGQSIDKWLKEMDRIKEEDRKKEEDVLKFTREKLKSWEKS